MTHHSLEDKIQQSGGAVGLLRNNAGGAETGPAVGGAFTNWKDEQTSWRDTAAMFDLSHHQTDLTLRGPDAVRLLSELGVNSLANFQVGRAKQYVAVNEDGHLIGDAILDHVSTDNINLAGTAGVPDWVQFHIETGDYDVTWSRQEPTARNPFGHPERYRFQVTGPRAYDVLAKATGRPVPDIGFFQAGALTIGHRAVRALGHNMARETGLELTGPWSEAEPVREALLEAGQEFGLRRVGSRAPTVGAVETGWFSAPLPAVYTGDSMKAYREWLPAEGFEGAGALGGSLVSDDIRDYYLLPSDLGYARLVKFDHDFVGREALEAAAAQPAPHRKVTLRWNDDDVLALIRASMFNTGLPAKFLELPQSTYATWQYDRLTLGDRTVGSSGIVGYSTNEHAVLSLGVVDSDVPLGTEVTLLWGEENGGSAKPAVERHVQTEIRATVSRTPYSDVYNT